MIINPYAEKLERLGTSRRLVQDFDLMGCTLYSSSDNGGARAWFITGFYAPTHKPGIRAKVMDEKGFISFITQPELEVMLNVPGARAGKKVPYANFEYPSIDECEFAVDDNDLQDDLYDREMQIRALYPGILIPQGFNMMRRYTNQAVDKEEHLQMGWDGDLSTGMYPDTRLSTVGDRWRRVQIERTYWQETEACFS